MVHFKIKIAPLGWEIAIPQVSVIFITEISENYEFMRLNQ